MLPIILVVLASTFLVDALGSKIHESCFAKITVSFLRSLLDQIRAFPAAERKPKAQSLARAARSTDVVGFQLILGCPLLTHTQFE